MATARSANTVPLRIVQNGGQIVSRTRKAGGTKDFKKNSLCQFGPDGKIYPVPLENNGDYAYINSTNWSIHCVAVEDFDYSEDGTAKFIAYQEIDEDTIIELQSNGASAVNASNIGEQKEMCWDGDNSSMCVVRNLAATDPICEIVDVEQNWNPWKDESDGKHNLVRVKILSSVLDDAPRTSVHE